MTFDFAPDWKFALLADSPYSAAELGRGETGQRPPAHPDPAQMALLVGELFAEGTLSAEQLRAFAGMPELQPHLRLALGAPPAPGETETS